MSADPRATALAQEVIIPQLRKTWTEGAIAGMDICQGAITELLKNFTLPDQLSLTDDQRMIVYASVEGVLEGLERELGKARSKIASSPLASGKENPT